MNEDQIKKMVDRFLTWRLPDDFNPDAGISFEKTFNEHTAFPRKHEPVGTNLFDATQATAMVRHMVEGLPAVSDKSTTEALDRGIALVEAFLRYFNPNDLPEDQSQQWQQLEHWAKSADIGAGSGLGTTDIECHKSDTPDRVCFYEQDFYVLSNFSSFSIMWEWTPREGDVRFDTSEAVYHFLKFKPTIPSGEQRNLMRCIRYAPSAHEAFKIAERHKHLRRPDWDDVKVDIMRDILRAKAEQHEYVRRKLLATGDRELVEDSWRDDFWGWGPNRDGKNMLGKLWMGIRAELRAAQISSGGVDHG
ncbi:NADAR family protein [Mesorhizobium sp. M6A.T.Ce.TU.016.01.1.1]|uniref:NADAR family protein n=1 Tax=Mesorhizobium sp. M6A.T.Ce.TU.016.01.1.1 TaxID=2496783 RepID=UPI000FCC00D5|nr:NADAR family protein [Mesorhizobium sp. M6A.T.Ce.TU.016.01.1.1]RUU29712.1 NADAR family protein [Mesorhizobium sp. M6A.T.Ce.TU.016.01.1.1]